VETLLRWRRAAARPEISPLPLDRLPLFLAQGQSLVDRGSGPEGVQVALERLFGFVAPAALWETDLLPARVEEYRPGHVDALFDESPLRWFGAGRERVAFAFAGDLDLFAPGARFAAADDEVEGDALERVRAAIRSAPRGADLEEILERSQLASTVAVPALWALAWRGEVAGDSMRALRQGIDSEFAPPPRLAVDPAAGAGGRRSLRRRWQSTAIVPGRYHFRPEVVAGDPIPEAERARELARVLLERHGVVFRELAALEAPGLWSAAFRSLRTLELSGEIVAGRFFDGVPGLQFATPRAVERLRDGIVSDAPWWCSAIDAASPCGIDLESERRRWPRRVATTRLVFRGARLVAVLRRGGAEIEIREGGVAAGGVVEPLAQALTRSVRPERSVDVETINGEPAAASAFAGLFDAFDRTRGGDGSLRLRRRYAMSAVET
jgi:ATP-dependent Lhr-like helicase